MIPLLQIITTSKYHIFHYNYIRHLPGETQQKRPVVSLLVESPWFPKLNLFLKFSIFNCYRIYRTAILTLHVKVIDVPKCVRSKIPIFSAFLTIYEGHSRYSQIVTLSRTFILAIYMLQLLVTLYTSEFSYLPMNTITILAVFAILSGALQYQYQDYLS